MAPVTKYLCPCFKCSSKKELTERTIKIHLKENLAHLNHLRASGTHQSSVDFVQNCYNQVSQLLNSLARWSGYPNPDSECPHILCFNYLLICLDLADASVAPPSFLEGGSRDNDAMMVDDDGKLYIRDLHIYSDSRCLFSLRLAGERSYGCGRSR